MAAAIVDTNAWAQLFAQGFVSVGLLEPNDLTSLPSPTVTTLADFMNLQVSAALAPKDLNGCLECLELDGLGNVVAVGGGIICVVYSLGACTPLFLLGEGGGVGGLIICLQFHCPGSGPVCGTSQNGGATKAATSFLLAVKDLSTGGGGSASGTECKPPPKDPNEKQGPTGFGNAAFVGVQQPWLCTIYFENVSNAQAYARQVIITDPLDPSLDIRTFRVTEIAIGDVVITVPPNRSFYQTRIPAPAPNPTNVVIDISAGVDVQNNSVFWTMNAIDLNTGELVTSVNQGVLPPDVDQHSGQGHVVYTVKPLAGSATGTVITNQASIVFDTNDPLDTNLTANTVDGVAPTSYMPALPAAVTDTNFVVSWFGTDDVGGSGIQNYDIYVSDNGSQYVPLLLATTANSATFSGVPAHAYAFYSLAHDNAGNVESMPSAAKAFTYVHWFIQDGSRGSKRNSDPARNPPRIPPSGQVLVFLCPIVPFLP